MKFKSLGNNADQSPTEDEAKLFEADLASERAARGESMTPVGKKPLEAEAASVSTPAVEVAPADLPQVAGESAEAPVVAQADAPAIGAPTGASPAADAPAETPMRRVRLLDGVLLKHGSAHYLFDKTNKMSYFVTIKNERGQEKTQWGIDLARAMAESPVHEGARIYLEDMGKQMVTVQEPVKDAEGNVTGHVPREVERVVWNVYGQDPGLNSAPPQKAAKAAVADADIDSDAAALVDAVSRGVEARDATLANAQAADATPRRRASDMAPGGPAAVSPQAGANAAHTVGNAAGGLLAGALSVPFIGLTSAYKHLKQTFGARPDAKVVGGPALGEKGAPPVSLLNSQEKITAWKCDRIEKMGRNVLASMEGIRNLDGFPVWEEMLLDRASKTGKAPGELVANMASSPDLADLKDKMSEIWAQNPEKIADYRAACSEFERNVQNVVKEFPNSEESIKQRVTSSMNDVVGKSSTMPGFGDQVGEYGATIAERIRLLVAQIQEFVRSLLAKITGKSDSPELSA
jgi:hypothetical protein